MLIAMWLVRTYAAHHPERFGPFKTADERRAVVTELREQHPGCALLDVDVYSDGTIAVDIPWMEHDR